MENIQSIIDNRYDKNSKQSIIDNRVKSLHTRLCSTLHDDNYGIGHTYKIAHKLSDYDIISLADYCSRKARKPAAAFISLCEKKIQSYG